MPEVPGPNKPIPERVIDRMLLELSTKKEFSPQIIEKLRDLADEDRLTDRALLRETLIEPLDNESDEG